mmetsp:Transcript_19934/g.41650  ORF Transcript_19934/g.41650 Transcript_19934/m.41650 type:complete len:203 (-) Transcript_19934:1080-1688(-)
MNFRRIAESLHDGLGTGNELVQVPPDVIFLLEFGHPRGTVLPGEGVRVLYELNVDARDIHSLPEVLVEKIRVLLGLDDEGREDGITDMLIHNFGDIIVDALDLSSDGSVYGAPKLALVGLYPFDSFLQFWLPQVDSLELAIAHLVHLLQKLRSSLVLAPLGVENLFYFDFLGAQGVQMLTEGLALGRQRRHLRLNFLWVHVS